jgi:hypothetical protein
MTVSYDLGWIKLYRCACGRNFWQRPELVDPDHRCVTCRRAADPQAT